MDRRHSEIIPFERQGGGDRSFLLNELDDLFGGFFGIKVLSETSGEEFEIDRFIGLGRIDFHTRAEGLDVELG